MKVNKNVCYLPGLGGSAKMEEEEEEEVGNDEEGGGVRVKELKQRSAMVVLWSGVDLSIEKEDWNWIVDKKQHSLSENVHDFFQFTTTVKG